MTRAAIYARYSSDMQSEASIEDQIRLCEERAKREGWTVANRYTDHAISGASLMRPGIQMLMQDTQARRFDIVLSESLDRISRDQEDIAGVYKRLTFADVSMVTLSEGEISELHIGLKGTMGALYLKDLADKTRRGLRGRVEAGKSGGGNAYGYEVVKRRNDAGEPVRGERTIKAAEAEIVNRIFREYAAGQSPKAIAHRLNKEGVPGPRGEGWGPSTIHGNRRRGTGMLNNELYIGRLVWNRLRYIKDPDTGKRVSRPNPESEWIVTDVPELRIIDNDLWQAAKAKQKTLEDLAPEFHKKQRPRNLFSYLLKCGECGGGFSMVSQSHYGCSTARNKGTCGNRLVIRQDALEGTVLNVLRENLMDEELCAAFCEEYTRRMNQLRMEHSAALHSHQAELGRLEKARQRIIRSIVDGVPGATLKDEAERILARKEELEALIKNADEAPPLLHPSMAKRYRQEVSELVTSLNDPEHRTEAAMLIRGLIDRIVLKPNKAGDALLIDLHGDLAGILRIATNKDKPLESSGLMMVQDKMVAGAGFEPATFRL